MIAPPYTSATAECPTLPSRLRTCTYSGHFNELAREGGGNRLKELLLTGREEWKVQSCFFPKKNIVSLIFCHLEIIRVLFTRSYFKPCVHSSKYCQISPRCQGIAMRFCISSYNSCSSRPLLLCLEVFKTGPTETFPPSPLD